MDIKIFFGTIVSIFKSDVIVEGGTGAIEKKQRHN
jgi:O-antigen biosynthesis protein WbqP